MQVQSFGQLCFCNISTGLVKSLGYIDLAKDMNFRFLVTLDSFQSYTVNNMKKYFGFCGNCLPNYGFNSLSWLRCSWLLISYGIVFISLHCMLAIDQSKHYRWTFLIQAVQHENPNLQQNTCMTLQTSSDFCVFQFLLFKMEIMASPPTLSELTKRNAYGALKYQWRENGKRKQRMIYTENIYGNVFVKMPH